MELSLSLSKAYLEYSRRCNSTLYGKTCEHSSTGENTENIYHRDSHESSPLSPEEMVNKFGQRRFHDYLAELYNDEELQDSKKDATCLLRREVPYHILTLNPKKDIINWFEQEQKETDEEKLKGYPKWENSIFCERVAKLFSIAQSHGVKQENEMALPKILNGLPGQAFRDSYPFYFKNSTPFLAKVSADGLSMAWTRSIFSTNPKLEKNGTVRLLTDTFIPDSCLVYYFEAVISPRKRKKNGKLTSKPRVGIGVSACASFVDDSTEANQSYVEFLCNGKLVMNQERIKQIIVQCSYGDVVGCIIHMEERRLTFTLNGNIEGLWSPFPQFTSMQSKAMDTRPRLYPMITLGNSDAKVKVILPCGTCSRLVNGAMGIQLVSPTRSKELQQLLEHLPPSNFSTSFLDSLKNSSCICAVMGWQPSWVRKPKPYNVPPPKFRFNYELLVAVCWQLTSLYNFLFEISEDE